jgi:predicted transcriptional regulator
MAVIAKKPRELVANPKERTYKPTKAELAAIRKGEAALDKGEFVTLTEFLHEMDFNRRKAGAKVALIT